MGKKINPEMMIGLEFETRNNGKCFIIDYKKSKDVTVMFYDGYVRKTTSGDLNRGNVGKGAWCSVGTKVMTKFHGECEVVAYRKANDVDVKFIDGTVVSTRSGNLKNGMVMNPNNPKIFGVAINDVENSTKTKLYTVWHSMVRRCYSDIYHKNKPSYVGVKMQGSWLRFSNFKKDVEKLPFVECLDVLDYELDKDILSEGKGLYSIDTVSFVPREINSALIRSARDGSFKGYYINTQGYFSPSTKGVVDKYRKKLGFKTSYRTHEEALSVYKICKKSYLFDLAEKHKCNIDSRVYDKLVDYEFTLED